jgi:hypothetical protein
MAALKGFRYILGNADGPASRIDEPRSLFHLREELLIEQTFGVLVQWAVLRHQPIFSTPQSGSRYAHDGHDVTLRDHVAEIVYPANVERSSCLCAMSVPQLV